MTTADPDDAAAAASSLRSRSVNPSRADDSMATSTDADRRGESFSLSSMVEADPPPPSSSLSSSLFPRVVSGSAGSIVTALAVTPLEVVKVRLQAAASEFASASASTASAPASCANVGPKAAAYSPPDGVVRCRGCGTFVLNNGLVECLLPRSAVPYFDGRTGSLTDDARAAQRAEAAAAQASRRSRLSTKVRLDGGTFAVLRRIFRTEGFRGIYAGLTPTLAMGVPNTVLYFTAYDEIAGKLRERRRKERDEQDLRKVVSVDLLGSAPESNALGPLLESPDENGNVRRRRDHRSNGGAYDDYLIPLIGGSSARFLASAVTSPLELLRTRQASLVGSGAANGGGGGGIVTELRRVVRNEGGVPALFRGMAPTLWRDVPFSAVYWMFLERFKSALAHSDLPMAGGARYTEVGLPMPPALQAGQAFLSGAAAGMIAASCTTPFDVVKTRRQMLQAETAGARAPSPPPQSAPRLAVVTSACDHGGAAVYEPPPAAAEGRGGGTLAHLRRIAAEEGPAALWRGNAARTIKVAPACAIMISCYELGKRVLDP
eukprot:CAMPEP_0113597970 /NCGR_PEP_ID=MMETSP0015_2-20120614/41309_1 /TAXON_ID=2838 /ORGANISM="Odontella" /LENGTH=546 /DNA_ID=CAMNT_0000505899 /DNA_START=50 /DNA_END=1690 /DNA_ORIENTATION=+ /assembly_acc=CAM_ASM_000160